jgi:SAM-dependent MidA family methyltransferase
MDDRPSMIDPDLLPDASSLLSSRWSRDNRITFHPAQLYDGPVQSPIDVNALPPLIAELAARMGPLDVGAARMGVFTWDVACVGPDGPFVLQIPAALDQPGTHGRARSEVPRANLENMRRFAAAGLSRFVLDPGELITLASVPAATFAAAPEHHALSLGRGGLQVEVIQGERSWLIPLGAAATADLLAEMVAALAYHYDAGEAGGTALTDVFVNDGDFLVRRREDGAFDLRLAAARHREAGIGPDLLLLYLIQLMAYEDWEVGGTLVGLPVLASNPSVAFEGLVRGRRYRWRDLGRREEEGTQEALRWIAEFGRSPQGRADSPWADRFVAGRLPPAFGDDLRERWWRLVPLRTKLGALELRARLDADSDARAQARALASLVDGLSRRIGRADIEPGTGARINDLGRDGLIALLEEAGVRADRRAAIAGDLLARWPYRSLDHLLASVPAARPLRRRIAFGRALSDAEQGTLASLGPASGPVSGQTKRGAIANREIYGGLAFPAALQAEAVRAFPTFEAYMDAVLHDPGWGYYARRVSIGRGGDFITNPESLSPRYGGWIAALAFRCWDQMVGRGLISDRDPFPIVEFGAGNGRLARDIVDAAAAGAGERWRQFEARLAYGIYETSASLRERQRELLGSRARIAAGDARHPAGTLSRDFPGGVRGLVLTNEVPDAFGVHKVVMTPAATQPGFAAWAALVVPRVEPSLLDAVTADLARRVRDTDRALRHRFALAGNPGDLLLDAGAFGAVMTAVSELPADRAAALRSQVWFEEGYVPAPAIPALAAHLDANAGEYASALGAEDSGVVQYVNVHAASFIRELGTAVAAGFVLTTDYGDTTWNLVQGARRGEMPFRVYGADAPFVPRPNDPYSHPGAQDLTSDVNFTEIAASAKKAGFDVLHYGHERDLVGDDLPALARAAAGDPATQEFVGNPVFKSLLLGKGTASVIDDPLVSPLPLSGPRNQIAQRQK